MNYKNEFLFSESYLKDIIKRSSVDENLQAKLKTISEWREFADNSSHEQWSSSFIKPTLDTLGFSYQLMKGDNPNILFLYEDINKQKPISICYVISPNEDINCTISGKYWAEKIISTLKKHSLKWGILTEGTSWRIYHTKEPTPYETYLEINLESIIKTLDYNSFQMFYFFFRPINFVKNNNEECNLDDFKEKSLKATEYIEENLKGGIEKIEDGVLQTLCMGYIDSLKKSKFNEEERDQIYGGAILYLFRLLFLFYSSARELLKRDTIEIFENIINDSLKTKMREGVESNSTNIWLKLQNIFAEIDLTYNGGLFNPYESTLTRFIEENKVSDNFLYKVIFELGFYLKEKEKYIRIEYRDLSIRHLGSIYEELLEHHLYIAQEDVVVRRSGNKIRYIPQSQAGKISRSETIIEKDKVYFSEDAKERKLSGSYYTPEDVVEYIVENTVDAFLNEKKQKFLKSIEPLFEEINVAVNNFERNRLKDFVEEKYYTFIEESILSISVLDPTMGSGHFLVNATNHIANFIIAFLNEFYDHEVPINLDPMYWRRRVVENCIYGVDLNPLAVELAKLCLWITTSSKEKPLSFLNHHLKQGNALVGIEISDISDFLDKSKQEYSDLFSQSYLKIIREASQIYKHELGKITEARADIEEKKELLHELDKELLPYKKLYDNFTDKLVGELSDNDFWIIMRNWPFSNIYIDDAKDNKNYFHWDLEFPDVFNGDNPGFDCVIGNPPYVDYNKIKKKYRIFGYLTESCDNLYAFMVERSVNLINESGRFSMIVPIWGNSNANYHSFRNFIYLKGQDIRLSHYAVRPSKIFNNADMNLTIIILSKNTKNQQPESLKTTKYIRWHSNERKKLFDKINYVEVDFENIIGKIDHMIFPKIGSAIELSILGKIFPIKHRIADYLVTGNDEARDIYVHSGGRYWRKAFDEVFVKKIDLKLNSNWKKLRLKKKYAYAIASLFNSSFFYWVWIVLSDCYNIRRSFLDLIPIKLNHNRIQNLDKLYANLVYDYKKYITVNVNYKYDNKYVFNISKSKPLIDLIDYELANHYGFNDEEINFIINYDSKYRMNE